MSNKLSSCCTHDSVTNAVPGGVVGVSSQIITLCKVCPWILEMVVAKPGIQGYLVVGLSFSSLVTGKMLMIVPGGCLATIVFPVIPETLTIWPLTHPVFC